MVESSIRTIMQNKHQNQHKNWSLSTKWSFVPWLSQSSDLNPVENEWSELKRRSTIMELWIWRIWRDSGWRNGLWSLIRCSPNSSGIIGENSELLRKGHCNNWVPIIVANMRENIYFTMRFSPLFQLVHFNDRLEICKKINGRSKG